MAPQLIYLALSFIGIGVELDRHGQPKTGVHNAWTTIVAFAIIVAIQYWGGFYDVLFR